MILRSLAGLADRENLVSDPAYEVKPVHYRIEVSKRGAFVALHDLRDHTGKGKPLGRRMQVPRPLPGDRRTGTIPDPGLLVDNATFALGIDPAEPASKRKAPNELSRRLEAFRARVEEAAGKEPALQSVLKFLDDQSQRERALGAACALPKFEPNHLFCFADQETGEEVHSRPSVRSYWGARRSSQESLSAAAEQQCLVTGAFAAPADKHPQFKLSGGQSSGVSLVSFNNDAFESHGWTRNENAPVSRAAAEAYTQALSRLLDEHYPDPNASDGRSLPKQNIRLSGDTTALFWADDQSAAPGLICSLLESADPQDVAALYKGVWQGKKIVRDPSGRFHHLVLTGAQARAVIRAYHQSALSDTVSAVKQWIEDASIESFDRATHGCETRLFPLWMLLRSLAPLGDTGRLPPGLASQIFGAILRGGEFPISILASAVRRCRAEQAADGGPVSAPRAALMKATLNRLRERYSFQEVLPAMNETNKNKGYLLGRMFALIERMQTLALGDVNASVVDRYFGSACATPQAVFPRLMKTEVHHYRKALDSTYGRSAGWVHGQIGQLASLLIGEQNALGKDESLESFVRRTAGRIAGFPTFLPLHEQGLFALGYHQQRNEFYKARSKDKDTAAESSAAGPTDDDMDD